MSNEIKSFYSAFPFKLPLILDGATGTNLIKAGMPSGVCPEIWILENPDALVSLHKSYAEAGSDAVYAPTFGGNEITLASHRISDDKTEIINEALSAMAKSATKCLIGGDMSPTGKMIYPLGDMTYEKAASVYARQAAAMADSCDFFITETNISLAEARAAVSGIKSVSDKPIFATISVEQNGRTLCGDTPLAALISLSHAGVSAFGLNCSCGPAKMLEFITPLIGYSASLGVPLIAKPNAGMPREENGQTVFDMNPADFSDCIANAVKSGVLIIGGCCGTSPEYIAEIKKKISNIETASIDNLPDVSRLAATNSAVCEISENTEIMSADDFIDGDESAIVRLGGISDAEMLIENEYVLPAPFGVCGDNDAISLIAREYCGYAPIMK